MSSDADGAVGLAGVALVLDLDLHADDPMIVLLQSQQLVVDVASEPVRDLAVPSGDHNVHLFLLSSVTVDAPPTLASHLRSRSGALLSTCSGSREGGVRPADLVFVPTVAC